MLPQMGLSIATLVIFIFVTNWNGFMGPVPRANTEGLVYPAERDTRAGKY